MVEIEIRSVQTDMVHIFSQNLTPSHTVVKFYHHCGQKWPSVLIMVLKIIFHAKGLEMFQWGAKFDYLK